MSLRAQQSEEEALDRAEAKAAREAAARGADEGEREVTDELLDQLVNAVRYHVHAGPDGDTFCERDRAKAKLRAALAAASPVPVLRVRDDQIGEAIGILAREGIELLADPDAADSAAEARERISAACAPVSDAKVEALQEVVSVLGPDGSGCGECWRWVPGRDAYGI